MTKTFDSQIGLFAMETTHAPKWRSKVEFDPTLAERYKREAMKAAASLPDHHELLNLLRPVLVTIALSRIDRTATADDAQAWLADHGWSPGALGNAAGSLFRGCEWELVGYRQSKRTSRHRNRVGVWRLKESR